MHWPTAWNGQDQIVALYGILSRIRLMSGEEVVRQGEALLPSNHRAVWAAQSNDRPDRAVAKGHDLDGMDPLKEFSSACRKELLARHW